MSCGVYRLSAALLGHSSDVRAIATSSRGHIATASRDTTTKLWIPQDNGQKYELKETFNGHSGYVTSVCIILDSPSHPDGLVVTGSRDTTILVFPLGGGQPEYTLTGHSDTVSCLSWNNGVLASGSWDHTAKIWTNWECSCEMQGHEGPLWSVAHVPRDSSSSSGQASGDILTASADRTVKLWRDGKAIKTYSGHKDCVRGLTVLSADRFLSCSNDASVILWSIAGESIATYYSHTNFIYCVSRIGLDGGFTTGGEDRTIRVWAQSGECTQTIHLPAQSVWTVAALPNSDIVCGSSDGVCRVFSTDKNRHVDAEELKAFEESVAKSTMAVGDLGGVKKSELPGREALFSPGKKDGHTIMVREGEKINCYSWSAAEQQWNSVGEVVGGAGGSASTSGKVLFEGKEYDFVFDVELDEGSKLKLPFNASEDPYYAAQRFIHRHELPQEYLDQVATFIMNNTKGMTLGVESTSQFSDPFTGGSSYRPGGASNTGSRGPDPFTGGGRYVPGPASSSFEPRRTVAEATPLSSPFFPQLVPLKFESCNSTGILSKLTEFNAMIASERRLDDDQLNGLIKAVSGEANSDPHLLAPLEVALQWAPEHIWPALDVLRLALRFENVQQVWLEATRGATLVNLLTSLVRPPSPVNTQLLALRCLANMAAHLPGCQVLAKARTQVVSATVEISPYPNKNVEIAAATVLLNYSVVLNQVGTLEDKCQVLSGASAIAMCSKEPEAQFRALVALGTLLNQDVECCSLASSLDIKSVVQSLTMVTSPPKVGECAGHILRFL